MTTLKKYMTEEEDRCVCVGVVTLRLPFSGAIVRLRIRGRRGALVIEVARIFSGSLIGSPLAVAWGRRALQQRPRIWLVKSVMVLAPSRSWFAQIDWNGRHRVQTDIFALRRRITSCSSSSCCWHDRRGRIGLLRCSSSYCGRKCRTSTPISWRDSIWFCRYCSWCRHCGWICCRNSCCHDRCKLFLLVRQIKRCHLCSVRSCCWSCRQICRWGRWRRRSCCCFCRRSTACSKI